LKLKTRVQQKPRRQLKVDSLRRTKEVSREEALEAVRNLLIYIGEDPNRSGLIKTPERVIKAWENDLALGYSKKYIQQQVESILNGQFEDGTQKISEMIIVKRISFHSVCVVGSTFVETPRGRIPIQYLNHGDWIYTVNPETMELGIVKCENPRITQRRANLVRVYTDNDTVICTPNHKFLTYNRGWVEAKDLEGMDRIVSLYRVALPNKSAYVGLSARRWDHRNDTDNLLKIFGSNTVKEHQFILHCLGDVNAFTKHYIAHHKDEITWNNIPENLQGCSITEHNRIHKKLEEFNTRGTQEYEKRVNAVIDSTKLEITRAKRSISVKKYWDDLKEDPEAYETRCQQTSVGIMTHRNHAVIGVEELAYKEDVWCMDVPDTQTFFANGMAVHNCEHHMLLFSGYADLGYIPKGKILGLSKLARVVDLFSKRLQVQERLTDQIADFIEIHCKPTGVGVVVEASHSCMQCRGVKQQESTTVSSALRGEMLERPEVRAEFLRLIGR
jgi:GTP cyclohydrolase I